MGQDEEPSIPGVRVVAVGPALDPLLGTAGAASCPRSSSDSASLCICWSADVATTSSTPPRSHISPCSLRPRPAGPGLPTSRRLDRDLDAGLLARLPRPHRRTDRLVGAAACARFGDRAFALAELHAQRLRELGFRGEVTVLGGLYGGPSLLRWSRPAEPLVVYAGRHIPEKQVPALVPALARARERVPGLRGRSTATGPSARCLRAIERERSRARRRGARVRRRGRSRGCARRALCLVLPSRREGYGLVVVEAAALGTPSVVVAGADNAATELVEEGVNGIIAPSAEPRDLADAIVRVHEAGASFAVDRLVVRAERATTLARGLGRAGARGLRGVTRLTVRQLPPSGGCRTSHARLHRRELLVGDRRPQSAGLRLGPASHPLLRFPRIAAGRGPA